MQPNQEYINSIISKLERMNQVETGSKEPRTAKNSGYSMYEPKLEDPMQWMGRAAIEYMNRKQNEIL